MPKRSSPQLAKLTRPRLYGAVARERLFALIDEKRQHPVVWISGPPGAGKTTLAASYLKEADVPAIWYQIDPGDSDPATFFFYLKQAVESQAQSKLKPLPLLTPEYLPDLPGFARKFLRDAFTLLPGNCLWVFDNYHELGLGSGLHASLAAALTEVPAGDNILVLSRTEPPSDYAASLLNQSLTRIEWEELKLTQDEAQALAKARGIEDAAKANELYRQADGWMAGITLMIERSKIGQGMRAAARAETLETVFDYFGKVLFDQALPEAREVMLRTALLPYVTRSLAEAVCGVDNPMRHIDALYRRHLFISHIPGETDTYQYHALFHSFLRSRAVSVLTELERKGFGKRAAAQLEIEGRFEEAFAIYADAEEWTDAVRVAIDHAPTLIAQGRWKTLTEWGHAVPGEHVERQPWLGYWVGRSQIAVQPVLARAMLEKAYRHFESQSDKAGQLISAVGVLDALFFQFTDFPQMDPWIARIVDLLQVGVTLPGKEDQLRINAAVMMGATYRAPKHAMLETCVARVKSLILEDLPPNLKVTVASMLHAFGNMAVDIEAEDLAIRVARPLLSTRELTGWVAMFYLAHEGYTHYVHGRYQRSLECFDEVEDTAREHGLQPPAMAITWRGLCERRAGLIEQAEESLSRVALGRDAPFGYVAALAELLRGSIAFARGDIKLASTTLLKAYALSVERGSYNGWMLMGLVAANFTIAARDNEVARALLRQLDDYVEGPLARNYIGAIRLNQAWLAHREGDVASRDRLLEECLARAAEIGQRVRYRWYANALSELLPVAIRNGIEVHTATTLARQFHIEPALPGPESWPWAVKVYTLGIFKLLVEGKPLEFSRKVPKKVLLLLKALVAFRGEAVPEQKLVDALWPDEEGDAARRTLTITVHRLRSLLVHPKALHHSGGVLGLDRRVCWVDAFAFEDWLDTDADLEDPDRAQMDLYRGAFLSEDDVPWALASRERLRTKFTHAIGRAGESLERAGRYEQAVELYLRGIEADTLVESFYQGLMRCYGQLNRRTEALTTYRRLREILSVTLGVAPSAGTQRLFNEMRQD